jgi:hypothetical protein
VGKYTKSTYATAGINLLVEFSIEGSIHMKCYMTGQEKDGLLIQVTA